MLGRLIHHTSHYTLGSLLVTLASIVSFPVFTRTFSVADYGALNLLSSLLLLWTGIGKLGIQHSIVRFHAEARAGRGPVAEPAYISTVLIGMTATGIAACAGWAIAALLVPVSWWNNDTVARLLLPLTPLLLVRVLDSAASNILRAQQRSVLFNVYAVLRKYLGIAAILVLIFTVLPGLDGFYLGTFVVEAIGLAVILAMLVRGNRLSAAGFSGASFRAMLSFGLPMIAFELAGVVLILGDRYVIQMLMGAEALGHYSAAYNLSQYVQMVIFTSLAQAVTPIYSRMWEEQGEEATRRFVERSLHLYVMIAVPVVAGMSAVGGEVLTTLASEKYAEGAVVIPLVVAGMCIDGGIPLFAAGMYIHKSNRMLVPFMIAAAALNIALNVALIPSMGLLGAAFATFICYLLLAVCAWHLGSRRLQVRFPWADLAKFSVLGLAMYGAVHLVTHPVSWVEVAARVILGAAVYTALVILFDRQARDGLALALGGGTPGTGGAGGRGALRSAAKHSVNRALASRPGWAASALMRRRGAVAVMYHRINRGPVPFAGVPVEQFRAQMQWLKANCTPVWPEEVLDAAQRADRIRTPVLITFDDGYRDYHDCAYPILRELGIPAAVFVSTHSVDSGELLWTERVFWAMTHTGRASVHLPWDPRRELALSDRDSRAAATRECTRHLKGVPDAERVRLLDILFAELDAPDPRQHLDRQMLSWSEIRATLDGTRYGGHSHTHPILSQLPAAQMEAEIRLCRDRLAGHLGQEPRIFAYPNGRPQDFNGTTRDLLLKYGFKLAFSTVMGNIGPGADPLALRRQHAGGHTIGDFAALIARA